MFGRPRQKNPFENSLRNVKKRTIASRNGRRPCRVAATAHLRRSEGNERRGGDEKKERGKNGKRRNVRGRRADDPATRAKTTGVNHDARVRGAFKVGARKLLRAQVKAPALAVIALAVTLKRIGWSRMHQTHPFSPHWMHTPDTLNRWTIILTRKSGLNLLSKSI